MVGGIAQNGGLPVDELLLHHIDGELEGSHRGPLAVARLQHEQLAFLNREFDVLHILEVFF